MDEVAIEIIDPIYNFGRVHLRQLAIGKADDFNPALLQFAAEPLGIIADTTGLRRP